MRLTLSVICFLFVSILSAQMVDSSAIQLNPDKGKWAFGGGIGTQFPLNTYSGEGHDYASVNYHQCGTVWLNAIKVNGDIQFLFRLKSSYRQGSFEENRGGQGGGSGFYGDFKILKTDIGAMFSKPLGRRRNFFIGGGIYLGGIALASGSVTIYEWNGATGFSSIDKGNTREALDSFYAGFSIDIHQQFRLNKKHCLLLGLNALLESPELSYSSRFGKVLDIYLAYKFHRKK